MTGLKGCVFASLIGVTAPAAFGQTVTYIHTDALGTPVAATDASGNLVEISEYAPYGELLNRPVRDAPGYTGHVEDAATGLTYMQQRYYDPQIGRFLSVDPVTAYDGMDLRHFNRYTYAFNNPYRFTDPDGRCPECRDWFVSKGILPGGPNAHTPIPGASRGDAKVVGLLAGSAAVGVAAGAAVAVGAPSMVMAAAEGASLQTGLVAQQGLNAASGAAATVATVASGTVEADMARTAYVSAAANMEKIVDVVSSAVVPGPPAMTPAGAAAGLASAIVGEVDSPPPPPPPPEIKSHR